MYYTLNIILLVILIFDSHLVQSCEVVGVFNLKHTTTSSYANARTKTKNTNTQTDNLTYVMTRDVVSGVANIYAIELIDEKAPLYKKKSNIQEYEKFKTFKVLSHCTHNTVNDQLQKTLGRHDNCPVDIYYYGVRSYKSIRDTTNIFMSYFVNNNVTFKDNYQIQTTINTSIQKVSWSDKYVKSLTDLVDIVQKTDLPSRKVGLDNWSSTPMRISLDDGYVWGTFIKQQLPVSDALRPKNYPYDIQKTKQVYESGFIQYKEDYNTLFTWDIQDFCVVLHDAIYGLNSGLLIDLYSQQRGTYTESEFARLKQLMVENKSRYNYVDTLIQKYKSIIINGSKTDTLITKYEEDIKKINEVLSKIADFKKDIFSKYISNLLLITPHQDNTNLITNVPHFISVRNLIRPESGPSTYASMIDSNLLAIYPKKSYVGDKKEYKILDGMTSNEYTESNTIPTNNLIDAVKKYKNNNVELLKHFPNVTDKSIEQIKSYMKYFIVDFKSKASFMEVVNNIPSGSSSNIRYFLLLLDSLQKKAEYPSYVEFSNYSIKKPFNSFYSNLLHRYINSFIYSSSYKDNRHPFEIEVVSRLFPKTEPESYYRSSIQFTEDLDNLHKVFYPYQDIFPKLIAYSSEFDRNQSNIILNEPYFGKLAIAYRLDSNKFKSDLKYYFDSCSVKGPTIDFFEEKKYTAFYWGDNHQTLVDTLKKTITFLENDGIITITLLKNKIDSLKRVASGIDNKIKLNMLEYEPYRKYVDYYIPIKPDKILEEMSNNHVELTPERIDSVYASSKREEVRLKDISSNSVFTVFRDGKSLKTLPYLEAQDKRIVLVKNYLSDSLLVLKQTGINSDHLDDIHDILYPKEALKKSLRDSINSIYIELYNEIKSLNYFHYDNSIIIKHRDILLDDTLFYAINQLKSKYFKKLDSYANYFTSLDSVSRLITTNIPDISANSICEIVKDYEQSKGYGTIWNTKSNLLLIDALRYLLFTNRLINQRGQYGGKYYPSTPLKYDTEEGQWIVDKPNSDEEYWFLGPSCLQRTFMGFKLSNNLFHMNSLYFNVEFKY